MRILHTADWHLGDRLGRQDRTDDLRRAVERVAGLLHLRKGRCAAGGRRPVQRTGAAGGAARRHPPFAGDLRRLPRATAAPSSP